MKRKRYGVVQRSSPERRTFRGVVYDSRLDCSRAMQHAAQEPTGLIWTYHPRFTLGCPENIYTADFLVKTPEFPCLLWEPTFKGSASYTDWIPIPDGYVEEVKGPVRTGVGRLRKLWRTYGKVPLVILTGVGNASGLKQQWRREVVIPDSIKPKRIRRRRTR